ETLIRQVNELQKKLDELMASILSEAKVIATTLTKSYSSKEVLARGYDCVIVDEASMAPLPALWFASGIAKQKVVFVGDFYQLPPIANYQTGKNGDAKENQGVELVLKWLRQDIFEYTGITKAVKAGIKPSGLQQLKVQYRMHPDIADIVNR